MSRWKRTHARAHASCSSSEANRCPIETAAAARLSSPNAVLSSSANPTSLAITSTGSRLAYPAMNSTPPSLAKPSMSWEARSVTYGSIAATRSGVSAAAAGARRRRCSSPSIVMYEPRLGKPFSSSAMSAGGNGAYGRRVLAEENRLPSRRIRRTSAIFVTTQAPITGE